MNNTYYRELSKFKALSQEETNELIIKYQSGNEAALNPIVESHLKLVVYYANKFKNNIRQIEMIEIEDLISEGNLALIRAVERFNPELDNKFSYYASILIVQSINDFIQNNKNILKNANNRMKSEKKIKARINELTQEFMTTITATDLTNLDEFTPMELDRYDNINFTEQDMHSKPLINMEEDEMFDDEDKRRLWIAMSKLNEREVLILKNNFGMLDEKLSAPELAKKLNISKMRVYQLRDNALRKLNALMTNKSAG